MTKREWRNEILNALAFVFTAVVGVWLIMGAR